MRATLLTAVMITPILAALAAPGAAHAASSPDVAHTPDYTHALDQLAAHKAVYTLTFAASPKQSVVGARGTMSYEVIDACDGWATQQRLAMDVTSSEGQTLHMVTDYSTWEAKNGSKLRFRMRQTTDTAVTMQLSGEAEEGPGGGVIHYVEPKPATVKLPAGTLFPMAHTAHIMAVAQAGGKFITLPLFDGSSDAGAEDTFTVVTANQKAGAPAAYPALLPLPSSTVDVTFFDRDSQTGTPDYQQTMRYWTNGVADSLLMDFGDFTVNGKLTAFTLSPHAC